MARNDFFDIDIESNIQAMMKIVPPAFRKDVPSAAAAALNRTVSMNFTLARREIAKRLGITQKEMQRSRAALRKTRANPEKLEASVKVRGKGRPPNVIRFSSDGAIQTAKGVRHGAWQSGRKKTLAVGTFLMPKSKGPRKAAQVRSARPAAKTKRKPPVPKRFTATVETHFVAKRRGNKIVGVFGGWPARELIGHKRGSDGGVARLMFKQASEVFPRRFEHEMNRRIEGMTRRIPKPKSIKKKR